MLVLFLIGNDGVKLFELTLHLMARLEASIKSVREISGFSVLGLIKSKMPAFLLVQVWFRAAIQCLVFDYSHFFVVIINSNSTESSTIQGVI